MSPALVNAQLDKARQRAEHVPVHGDGLVPAPVRPAAGYQPFNNCRAITMRWIWLVPS